MLDWKMKVCTGIPEGEVWLLPRSRFQPVVRIVNVGAEVEVSALDPGCGLPVPLRFRPIVMGA